MKRKVSTRTQRKSNPIVIEIQLEDIKVRKRIPRSTLIVPSKKLYKRTKRNLSDTEGSFFIYSSPVVH